MGTEDGREDASTISRTRIYLKKGYGMVFQSRGARVEKDRKNRYVNRRGGKENHTSSNLSIMKWEQKTRACSKWDPHQNM